MRQIGGRIWLGAAIGFIAGTVAGLVLAVAFHQHAYAFWGFVLGGAIFGTILGGFVGGMSSLESPAPGQEPGDGRS
jgi:O-antigen/teichoic acid export membrane protein